MAAAGQLHIDNFDPLGFAHPLSDLVTLATIASFMAPENFQANKKVGFRPLPGLDIFLIIQDFAAER